VASPLELSVLGPLEVVVAGAPVRLGDRSRALLLALVLRRGEVVPRDRLVELLWAEEAPRDARNALQVLVSRLRRSLGPGGDAIVTREPGYVLELPDEAVDAAVFEQRVVAARQAATAGRAVDPAELVTALARWRGDPFADVADDPEAVAATSRLQELRLEAVDLRAEAALARGGGVELIADLRAAVTDRPDRARTHRALALALYRTGRQVEALDALAGLRATLRDEHGLDPDVATEELVAALLRRDPALDHAPDRGEEPGAGVREEGLRSLPLTRNSFVGRRSELEGVRRALGNARVVTLIGPGGTGKTRLAIEALRDLPTPPKVAVAFVDLAPLGDPADVPGQVATALGIDADGPAAMRAPGGRPRRLEDRIRERVRDGEIVLLLDNCEHVADAVAEMAEMLVDAGPGVRVLATSREALRVDGEHLFPVAPLALPDADTDLDDPERALEHDAVRLFVDRARTAGAALTLDPDTTAAVVVLCRRLDGLPLALELAAARTSTLPVTTLIDRLGDRFRLLTGGRRGTRRQRTLDAVVAWSYDLLDQPQQRLLRQLGAFSGPVDVDLVAAVVAEGDGSADGVLPAARVLPTLLELADRSLLTLVDEPPLAGDDGKGPRLTVHLLETIRAFAQDRLVRDDEAPDVRDRHASAVADRVAAAAVGLRGGAQLRWLDLLDRSQDEARAALAWWLESDPTRALALAVDLAWFWWLHDQHAEAARWLDRTLDRAGDHAAVELVAFGSAWLGFHELFDNRIEAAMRAVRRAEDLLGRVEEPAAFVSVAVPLLVTYVEALTAADPADALATMERAVARAEELGEDWVVSAGSFVLVGMAVTLGQHERARRDAERALAAARRTGDRWATFQTRTLLGVSHLAIGRYDDAEHEFATAVPLAQALGSRAPLRMLRTQQALVSMLRGDHDRAEVELTRLLADGPTHGRDISEGLVLNARATNRRRAGWVAAAVEDHRAAVRVFQDMQEDVGAAEAAAGLAYAEVAAGDLDAARVAVDLAVRQLAVVPGGIPAVTTLPLLHEAAAAVAAAAGDPRRAALHLGRATALREGSGAPLVAGQRADVDHTEAAIRAALGEAVDAQVAAGRGRSGLLPPLD
jgi:predicted ATPase/DNA-binding SARP family transcriptional activator